MTGKTMREEAVEFFYENGYNPTVTDRLEYAGVLATAELTALGRDWTLRKEGNFRDLYVELIGWDDSGPYPKVQVRYPYSQCTPSEWVSSDNVSDLRVTLRDQNGFMLNIGPLTLAEAFDEDRMRVVYAKMAQMAQEC